MKFAGHMLKRAAGAGLALLLSAEPGMAGGIPRPQSSSDQPPPPAAQAASQDTGASATAPQTQPAQTSSAELPDNPGAARSQASAPVEPGPSGRQSQPPAEPQQQPPSDAQRPVGTAAAETANTSGIAASRPAGVAIAPAKQGRARALLIKVGAVVGAGVAIGTVMALSTSTPSKPPGAH
jgi:hypothetical protein